MTFDEFERAASAAWEEIPVAYKEGVDGLTVRAEALAHPAHAGIFTLGECVTEAFPSGFDGPETLRSLVVLYHGSFQALASRDPAFDWEGELWETLTHELRHHLESLASEDGLEGVDYAMEHDFRRSRGEDFDPWYFQRAEEPEPGVFVAEDLVFLELEWEAADPPDAARFEWDGVTWEVPVPGSLGDVHYLGVDGLPPELGTLDVVLVRRTPGLTRLKRALTRTGLSVGESRATAQAVAPD